MFGTTRLDEYCLKTTRALAKERVQAHLGPLLQSCKSMNVADGCHCRNLAMARCIRLLQKTQGQQAGAVVTSLQLILRQLDDGLPLVSRRFSPEAIWRKLNLLQRLILVKVNPSSGAQVK